MASISFLDMVINISFNVKLRILFTVHIVRSTIARSARSRILNQTPFRKAFCFKDVKFAGVTIALILRDLAQEGESIFHLSRMKSRYESLEFGVWIPSPNSKQEEEMDVSFDT